MRRKYKILIGAITAVALTAAFLWWANYEPPVTIKIPNGPTLKLLHASWGERPVHIMIPSRNPIKRLWLGIWNTLRRREEYGTDEADPERTAVFWFTEDPPQTGGLPQWITVKEGAKPTGSLTVAIANEVRFGQSPGVVGIFWHDCPTNKETLVMSFYKRGQDPRLIKQDFGQSNLVSRIAVKNPAFHK